MRWMVIYEYEVPGGALNLNSNKRPRPWSPWGSSPSRKNPIAEPGIEPGTSWSAVKTQTTRPRGWSNRQCTYIWNNEASSHNNYCRQKAKTITYSERVSISLYFQHAKRMRHITLSSVASLPVPIFPHNLISVMILGKKVTEHKPCDHDTACAVLLFPASLHKRDIITRVSLSPSFKTSIF
jgi:hypothetical protein